MRKSTIVFAFVTCRACSGRDARLRHHGQLGQGLRTPLCGLGRILQMLTASSSGGAVDSLISPTKFPDCRALRRYR